MKIIVAVVDIIFDAIEACISTLTLAGGKQLQDVFFVCVGMLVVSIAGFFLKVQLFITWQESLSACVILAVILSIDKVNKAGISELKDKVLKIQDKIKHIKDRE